MSTDDDDETRVRLSTVVVDRMGLPLMFHRRHLPTLRSVPTDANRGRTLCPNQGLCIRRSAQPHRLQSPVHQFSLSGGFLFDLTIFPILPLPSSFIMVHSNLGQGCQGTHLLFANVHRDLHRFSLSILFLIRRPDLNLCDPIRDKSNVIRNVSAEV